MLFSDDARRHRMSIYSSLDIIVVSLNPFLFIKYAVDHSRNGRIEFSSVRLNAET